MRACWLSLLVAGWLSEAARAHAASASPEGIPARPKDSSFFRLTDPGLARSKASWEAWFRDVMESAGEHHLCNVQYPVEEGLSIQSAIRADKRTSWNDRATGCEGSSDWLFSGTTREVGWRNVSVRQSLRHSDSKCKTPPGHLVELRRQVQQLRWLTRDAAESFWPHLSHSIHSGFTDIGDLFEVTLQGRIVEFLTDLLEREQGKTRTSLPPESRTVVQGDNAAAALNQMRTLRNTAWAVQQLPALQHPAGGPAVARATPAWELLTATHPRRTLRNRPRTHPDDVHAWEAFLAIWPADLHRKRCSGEGCEETDDAREEGIYDDEDHEDDESEAGDRFSKLDAGESEELLTLAVTLCTTGVSAWDPCECPFVACRVVREQADGRTTRWLRMVGLNLVWPIDAQAAKNHPLPAGLALASHLQALDISGDNLPLLCHPQSQAVLRSFPRMRALRLSAHMVDGLLSPPTTGECSNGPHPWDSADDAPRWLHRACQTLKVAAMHTSLMSTPLAQTLQGLDFDIVVHMPVVSELFGMRPPKESRERFLSEFPRDPAVRSLADLARLRLRDHTLSVEEVNAAGPMLVDILQESPWMRLRRIDTCRDDSAHELGEDAFWNHTLVREREGSEPAVWATARVKLLGDLVVWPQELRWMCNFRRLLRLQALTGIAGFPECMGLEVPELRLVDVRGNWFSLMEPAMQTRSFPPAQALPPGLANWKKLTTFIAFEQSPVQCPPPDYVPRPFTIESAYSPSAREEKCIPTFYSLERIDPVEAASSFRPHWDGVWKCPRGGSWTAQLNKPSQPWLAWHDLQLFWVDANRMTGSLTDDVVAAWPHLRTIDLYSNDFTGTVPASVATWTDLIQAQLQDNMFSGLWSGAHPRGRVRALINRKWQPMVNRVDLRLNPGIQGCVIEDRCNSTAQLGACRLWVGDSPTGGPMLLALGTNTTRVCSH
jgi:hypothetical protein